MKLKFGMVGGGGGGIGPCHYAGAMMDHKAELAAGCFSRHEDKNKLYGELWGVKEPERLYADYRAMAEGEAARADGIDFVSIVTPNDTHYEIAKCFMEHGIHVMCDKPLAFSLEQGEELAKIAKERGLLFGLTYTYAGYAMVRQARELIERGELGDLLYVRAQYPQEWLAVALVAQKSDQSLWRLDPSRTGPSLATADIGTHCEHLIHAATGLTPERVLAKFDTYPRDLPLETNTTILLEYPGGVTGAIWASQIAIGHECDVYVAAYGTKGAIEWSHSAPGRLKFTRLNEPTQILTANRECDYEEANRLCRLPSGHPEGYFEAFGNLYRSFCEHLLAKKAGVQPASYTYPTVDDGIVGLKFIKACVESNRNGNVWVAL